VKYRRALGRFHSDFQEIAYSSHNIRWTTNMPTRVATIASFVHECKLGAKEVRLATNYPRGRAGRPYSDNILDQKAQLTTNAMKRDRLILSSLRML